VKKQTLTILLFAVVLFICSCSSANRDYQTGFVSGEQFTRTELIFGLSKPDGSIITETEWQQFVDEIITPGFRDGLTVIDAYGQWMALSGDIIKEPSKVVILLHKQTSENDNSIETIRREYKSLFQQESVLRITEEVVISF